jgi:hypothetical protein
LTPEQAKGRRCPQVGVWLDRWHLDPCRLARTSSLRRCDHVNPVKSGLIGYGFVDRCCHAPLVAAAADGLEAGRVIIERRTTVRPGAER